MIVLDSAGQAESSRRSEVASLQDDSLGQQHAGVNFRTRHWIPDRAALHLESIAAFDPCVDAEDLAWFWRGAFLRAGTVALAVDSVAVRTDTAGRRLTSIHLANRGALPMPVELWLTFADGSTHRVRLPVEIWYRANRYVYAKHFADEVTRVGLDWQKILPDVNRRNDVWPWSR